MDIHLPGLLEIVQGDGFIGFVADGRVSGAEDYDVRTEGAKMGAVCCKRGDLRVLDLEGLADGPDKRTLWGGLQCVALAKNRQVGSELRIPGFLLIQQGLDLLDENLLRLSGQGSDIQFESACIGNDICRGSGVDLVDAFCAGPQKRMGRVRDLPVEKAVEERSHFFDGVDALLGH